MRGLVQTHNKQFQDSTLFDEIFFIRCIYKKWKLPFFSDKTEFLSPSERKPDSRDFQH